MSVLNVVIVGVANVSGTSQALKFMARLARSRPSRDFKCIFKCIGERCKRDLAKCGAAQLGLT